MRKGGVGGNDVSHHHLNWVLFPFDTPSACGGELHCFAIFFIFLLLSSLQARLQSAHALQWQAKTYRKHLIDFTLDSELRLSFAGAYVISHLK